MDILGCIQRFGGGERAANLTVNHAGINAELGRHPEQLEV